MRTTTKRILALLALLVPVAVVLVATQFPLKSKVERRLINALQEQGLEDVNVTISEITQTQIRIATIEFRKDEAEVVAKDLLITATNLPYNELLRGIYSNIKVDWQVKSVDVSGIAYQLPQLTGMGEFYLKDESPVLVGEFHDLKLTHSAQFTVTPKTLLLENVHAVWEGADISSPMVAYNLSKDKPTYIPLVVRDLQLNRLLSLLSNEKAQGTGNVSGGVELVMYPDGTFGLGDGVFSADGGGKISIAPEALPGQGAQIDMARQAFSNFNYINLSIRLIPDKKNKVIIRLLLEGSNPDAFDGSDIKLTLNLTGDVLELLQQSLFPITDPAKLLDTEKDTK